MEWENSVGVGVYNASVNNGRNILNDQNTWEGRGGGETP